MSSTKGNPLALVAKVSNFIELCQEYNISKDQFNELMKNEVLSVADLRINLTEKKKFRGWDSIEGQLKDMLRQKIKSTPVADSLLAVILHFDVLVNTISSKIIQDIKQRKDEQGFVEWLISEQVSEKIYFYQGIQTDDKERGLSEYLEINISGTVSCDQKWFGTNDVGLQLSISFRAVTLILNLAASLLDFKISGKELMGKLKWYPSGLRRLS